MVSLQAGDTPVLESALSKLELLNHNQEAQADFKAKTELVTIGMQQKALENLLALSEKFDRTNNLTAQTSLIEQQIQIKALEKLSELAKNLDKKPKKESSGFSVKKLKDPVYLLDQIAKGILHVSGRVYDKCETVLVTIVTYSLILYVFFPGVWKTACAAYQVLGIIDGVLGSLLGTAESFLGNLIGFAFIFPQYFTAAGPYIFNGVRTVFGF